MNNKTFEIFYNVWYNQNLIYAMRIFNAKNTVLEKIKKKKKIITVNRLISDSPERFESGLEIRSE